MNWRDKRIWPTSFLTAFKRREMELVKGPGECGPPCSADSKSVRAFFQVHGFISIQSEIFFWTQHESAWTCCVFLYVFSFSCPGFLQDIDDLSQLALAVCWLPSTAWQVGPAMEFQKEFDYCKDLVLLGQWRVRCVKTSPVAVFTPGLCVRSLNWSHFGDSGKAMESAAVVNSLGVLPYPDIVTTRRITCFASLTVTGLPIKPSESWSWFW